MKKLLPYLVIIMILLSAAPSHKAAASSTLPPEPQIQVKLVNYLGNQTSITLKMSGNYYLNGSSQLLISKKGYTLKVEKNRLSLYDGKTKLATADTMSITPVNITDHAIINNREYIGSFRFIMENKLYVRPINIIYLDDYLKSVVPSEMYASWPKEALKTQAVAARTYAYSRLNKVIDDTTYNQVYAGTSTLHPNSTAAVVETSGELVTYKGKPIEAVFSASNGGMTENNYNEFGTPPLPYFPTQKDSYDTKINWSFSIKKQQINLTSLDLSRPDKWWNTTNEANKEISNNIKTWLGKNGYAGKQIKIVSIPKLALYEKTKSGRVSRGDFTITFLVKDKVDAKGKLVPQNLVLNHIIADKVRSIIGTTVMKSNLLSKVTVTKDAYSFSGKGYGHGVGMSQYGANNRANAGFKYKDILSFYYPSTVLLKQYQAVNRNKRTTGWIKAGTKWYYIDNTLKVKTGWLYTGSKWYYLDQNGVMKTGWVKLNSIWYYLDSSGAMKTGWVKVGSDWYYFYSNGSMASNTIIQGYKLGVSGAWIK